jgi:Uma2 family endonuclease
MPATRLRNGKLYPIIGQRKAHIAACIRTSAALRSVFGPEFMVTENLPYHLGEFDAPEPDVAVFRGSLDDYDPGLPEVKDVELFVEVVETRPDTAEQKIADYARLGIREY